jgi:citrate lyase subunit beta/citryl-CoA lyase
MTAESSRKAAERRTAALRADLPLRFLRQQAHLTAPASDMKLAEKAVAGASLVAKRLLDRYGLDAIAVGEHLGVAATTVEEVLESPAPAIVLDLEDGVPPDMVDEARANAVRLAREIDHDRTLCFIRPSGITDPRCTDDLKTILLGAAAKANEYPIDGIVFPKVRHAHEVEWLNGVLSDIEKEAGLEANRIRVLYLVETGWGVLNMPELATAGLDRLAGIILGTVDLSADLMLPEVRFRHPIAEWARMIMVTVAGSCGVSAIDGMTIDFPVARADLDAAQNRAHILDRMRDNFQDALHSIDTGMSGRWVGHPLQLVATLLAFRSAFAQSSIENHLAELEEFSRAMSMKQGAVAGATGKLLDVGTDRHVRQMLRRATAWGLIPTSQAHELGLISESEMKAAT